MKSRLLKTLITIVCMCSFLINGCGKDMKVSKSNDKDEVTDTLKPVGNSKEEEKQTSDTSKVTESMENGTENKTDSYIESLEGYQGAYYTKEYRNVFKECGYSEAEINVKLQRAWDALFYGGESTKIYYEVGEDEAYILDTGNQDVRSEGMSYGMMMCVQMDKKEEFNRLWKWAKTHMQNTSGPNEGYFGWSINTDGTPKDTGPAPDGEEYFALSLFFASNRWGDGEEPYDYSNQARYILRQALHQEDDGVGNNMWNTENKLIKFVPTSLYSDPSYHLPHFYELFALWADEEDRDFWKEAGKASREYLKLACHPETGLAAEYATYEGIPVEFNGHEFFYCDSYRVAGNIGLDYMWFANDPWQVEQSKRIQDFFVNEGIGKHYSKYSIDGVAQKEANYQATGLVAMNAMASLAAEGPNVVVMIDDLWRKTPATGKWRYYDDCLYFFGLLSLSGNYRIWE